MKKKNKKKKNGILIDFYILTIFAIVCYILVDVSYKLFGGTWSRIIWTVMVILGIPVTWGTMICSVLGKNTIGHRIATKLNKKYNDKDTNSK